MADTVLYYTFLLILKNSVRFLKPWNNKCLPFKPWIHWGRKVKSLTYVPQVIQVGRGQAGVKSRSVRFLNPSSLQPHGNVPPGTVAPIHSHLNQSKSIKWAPTT